MGKDKKNHQEINLLRLIPERVVDHEITEGGKVILSVPRFKSRIMQKLVMPRLKDPCLKVDLDEVGSAVWKLCDGSRNVGQIAQLLTKEFGEDIEPCHERLGLFFNQLERARFIRFANLEEYRNQKC